MPVKGKLVIKRARPVPKSEAHKKIVRQAKDRRAAAKVPRKTTPVPVTSSVPVTKANWPFNAVTAPAA